MRAGLTRAEVCPMVRRGLDANENAVQYLDSIYVDVEAVPVVARVGGVATGTFGAANGGGRGVPGV